MKSEARAADVVIIGGGYSGTMLAAELAGRGVSAALVEGGGRAGRGTAYSTPEGVHLLNVPAGCMSAWSDQPDHFAKAVAGEGFGQADFVPRRRYGEYLRAILAESGVAIVEQRAVRAEPGGKGWNVSLADGSQIAARALVLAQGNQPPEPLGFARDLPPDLFVNNPWSEEGRAAVGRVAASGGDVLIIGTGLTMIDAVLSLDEAGHRGKIVALSRRGQVPRAHTLTYDPVSTEIEDVPQGSVLALLRWLRKRGAEVGWRAAVDGLRAHSQALWHAFGINEQRRFLRHARPWWDVHRHRIAPAVAARVERMIAEGRLEIVAGRVGEMRERDGGLEVVVAPRSSQRLSTSLGTNGTRRFSLVLNCTGPLGAIRKTEDGVLKGLFAAGLARADRLGMGVEVEGVSRVAGAERAWAVGPLTKGAYWEIVAVPDIRDQVAEVAEDIAKELADDLQSR